MDATAVKPKYYLWGKSAVMETAADMLLGMVPIWVAVAVGLLVGWSWKPQWASILLMGIKSRPRLIWGTPPGFGARRFWLAIMAVSAFPMWKEAWKSFSAWMWPTPDVLIVPADFSSGVVGPCEPVKEEIKQDVVSTDDLLKLMNLMDGKDGGPEWQMFLDKSISDLKYQAWRRDPEDDGPTEYKTRTVVEDMSPEAMRDFFWDDEFRRHWDEMLSYTKTWEACEETGFMIVQWVRKFPILWKDREYVIARRMWESNNTYYAVTKGTQYAPIPKKLSPRRVDTYFSSWTVRAVESARGDGQMTACEVLCFHYEDMGIQRDLAKLGIRRGMWGCVKKMSPGIDKYRAERKANIPLSASTKMARKCCKVPRHLLSEPESSQTKSIDSENVKVVKDIDIHHGNKGCMKWIILGGAVALACSIDRGAVGKFLVFGVAKRLGRVGRRL
ncbi:uncharacterized protein [Physcomitrium patens]|uniref:START domain-containing protein n=1 Tax=Physcomitrium patens TaxID=3218 RepID=A0A2K1K472_PHYPA|nr:uncharacterized protein LOC112287059 [Physcomitrium patens]XP_024385446.1 uncharacterized protein LOC112287059 [Physcomitrium patens]XP_024385447.1 uncharacterized protein LOC112287059 [Physcomitrium patens]PNR48572.1 hypothetical protein PHYPA_013049 [Physcomitrium patens]|eukprot:XP_024385445.1 uncharacterized protein LOC112287059 [Physcomitrella patens]